MVRDPSLAGLLTVVLVSAPLSFSCAVLRAWLLLAVERERQATARLAIWRFAGAGHLSPPSMPAGWAWTDAPGNQAGDGQ